MNVFMDFLIKKRRIKMNKKGKVICLIIVFMALCALLSAVGIRNNRAVTDFKQYGKWDKKEIKGTLKIFPDSLEELGAENYYYKCTEGIFDSECQIYLQCKMTEEKFDSEKERLSKILDKYEDEIQEIVFDENNFKHPAYVTIYNFDSSYEYALLDEEQKIIHYIHLQFVPEKNVAFDSALLPQNYLLEPVDGINIYAHWSDDLEGWHYNDN